jgi:hypothetical protein
MKNKRHSLGFRFSKAALLAACSLFLTHLQSFASPLLSAGVDLGAAGRTQNWAIFSLGVDLDDTDTLRGRTEVFGNIGVAGTGNITLKGRAVVDGTIAYHTGGLLKQTCGTEILGGTVHKAMTDSILNQGVLDASAASKAAYALSLSTGYPSAINANKSLTLSGSGKVVLKLTDFTLSCNSTLTLQGNAGTAFIINVSNKFSLDGGASVQLASGLTWNNVLFNIRGSGGDVSLKESSELNGIILATDRTVKLSGKSEVFGEIIASRVALSSGSQVTRPPIISP